MAGTNSRRCRAPSLATAIRRTRSCSARSTLWYNDSCEIGGRHGRNNPSHRIPRAIYVARVGPHADPHRGAHRAHRPSGDRDPGLDDGVHRAIGQRPSLQLSDRRECLRHRARSDHTRSALASGQCVRHDMSDYTLVRIATSLGLVAGMAYLGHTGIDSPMVVLLIIIAVFWGWMLLHSRLRP